MAESEVQRSLGRIEGKIDGIASRLDAKDKLDIERDRRIDSVQRRQWWLSGVAAAIGALLGISGGDALKM